MNKSAINLFCLFIVLVIFSLIGCAGETRGKLKRVQQPTENGLKQDWQNYTVKLSYTYVRTSGGP